MTRDVSNDPADYVIGVMLLGLLLSCILGTAVWFVTTGSGIAFFLALFYGKFADWLIFAPEDLDGDE